MDAWRLPSELYLLTVNNAGKHVNDKTGGATAHSGGDAEGAERGKAGRLPASPREVVGPP